MLKIATFTFEEFVFLENRHMKLVKLPALGNGRFYPSGSIPGTYFCYSLSQPPGHSAAGRIMSMKNPVTPAGIEPATFRLEAQ